MFVTAATCGVTALAAGAVIDAPSAAGLFMTVRLGFPLRQAQRNASVEICDAIRLISDMAELVTFPRGGALVIQEVAQLTERLTVGVTDGLAGRTTGARFISHASRDAGRKPGLASFLVASVAQVVTVGDLARPGVSGVTQRAQRFADSRRGGIPLAADRASCSSVGGAGSRRLVVAAGGEYE
jgi:hypothetical protein